MKTQLNLLILFQLFTICFSASGIPLRGTLRPVDISHLRRQRLPQAEQKSVVLVEEKKVSDEYDEEKVLRERYKEYYENIHAGLIQKYNRDLKSLVTILQKDSDQAKLSTLISSGGFIDSLATRVDKGDRVMTHIIKKSNSMDNLRIFDFILIDTNGENEHRYLYQDTMSEGENGFKLYNLDGDMFLIRSLKMTNNSKGKLRYFLEKAENPDIVVDVRVQDEVYLLFIQKCNEENTKLIKEKYKAKSAEITKRWKEYVTPVVVSASGNVVSSNLEDNEKSFQVIKYNLDMNFSIEKMKSLGQIDDEISSDIAKTCSLVSSEIQNLEKLENVITLNGSVYRKISQLGVGGFAEVHEYSKDGEEGTTYAIRHVKNYYSHLGHQGVIQQKRKELRRVRGESIRRNYKRAIQTYKMFMKVPENTSQYFYEKYIYKTMFRLMNEGKVDTDFVVKIFDVVELMINGEMNLFIIMEKMDGTLKSLFETAPSESQVIDVLAPVANGLLSINANALVHSDLKRDNILYRMDGEKQIIKIADFGCTNREKMFPICMTKFTFAPRENGDNTLDVKDDVFSLGVLALIIAKSYEHKKFIPSRGRFPIADELLDKYLNIKPGRQLEIHETLQTKARSKLWNHLKKNVFNKKESRETMHKFVAFLNFISGIEAKQENMTSSKALQKQQQYAIIQLQALFRGKMGRSEATALQQIDAAVRLQTGEEI